MAIETKNSISSHLKTHSPKVDLEDINILLNLTKDLEVIEPKKVALPTFYKYNFLDLNREEKGFICIVCNRFACKSYKVFKRYLNIIHNIKSKNKGFNNIDFKPYYKENYPIETLFRGAYTKFFAINTFSNTSTTSISSINNNSLIEDIINNYKEQEKEIEGNTKIITRDDLNDKDISGFLEKTYFNLYIYNKDISKYLNYISKPDIDIDTINFTLLDKVYKYTIKVLKGSENLLLKFNRRLLQQLLTESGDLKELNLRPFKLLQDTSKSRYYRILAELITYIFRLYFLKIQDIENIDRQPILEDDLLNLLYLLIKDLKKEINSPSTIIDSSSIIENSIVKVVFKLLEQKTIQLAINSRGLLNSPIITFFILKSINPITLNFKDESLIENNASYLLYTFRLIFLKSLEIKDKEASLSNISFNLEEEFYKGYNNLLTNNSNNAFEELTQLRRITRKIVSNKTKESRIVEIDNFNISIDNKVINLTKLEGFFHSILERLEIILYKDLLELDKESIDIDLNSILDNPLDSTPNLYFIDYITTKQDLSKYKTLLINRVLDINTSFSKKYINSIESTTTRNSTINKIEFNASSISKFLKNKRKFLELLSIAIYLTSSSPI